ncbi:unnamed protein product [marine sediment metagenome]|uniref:Uncharacterized protein n=1 Tax=marine sediment metagenome TaxID=412755 RepID=X1LCT4_9ZZZZ
MIFKIITAIIIWKIIGEFRITSLETSHPLSIISNSFEEFISMVLVMGSKKFIKRVSSIERLTSPISMNAQFFKFLSGLLVIIRLIISNVAGIKITGPNSIIYLTTL